MPTKSGKSKKSSSIRKSAGAKNSSSPDKAARSKKSSASKKSPAQKKSGKPVKKWSGKVTRTSNALDLEANIFESHDPEKIAESLKHSAEKSTRKKGTPYQSAMSMLNFYINRAGKNSPVKQKEILEKAKDELRQLFGRDENGDEKTTPKKNK